MEKNEKKHKGQIEKLREKQKKSQTEKKMKT